MWLLLVLALVSIGLLVVSSAWLSQLTPLGAALTDQGLVVHALSGKALTLTAAVLFFGLLDTVFLPFLNIREVMFGAGPVGGDRRGRRAGGGHPRLVPGVRRRHRGLCLGRGAVSAAVSAAVAHGRWTRRRWATCLLVLGGVLLATAGPRPSTRGGRPSSRPRWRGRAWRRSRPRFAAQIAVESNWQPQARSRYAAGLAQFTPPTWSDIAPLTRPSCAGVPETDPACSVRAQLLYMRRLLARYRVSASDAYRWAFAWAAYNGGPGWISREKARCRRTPSCRPERWWGQVERHCLRAAWACRENRAYPRKILLRLG